MRIPEVKASAPTPANIFYAIRQFEVARETETWWLSKCIEGLFWARMHTWWQIRPPKQSHNALWQPSRPGPVRNLKVANIQLNLLSFFGLKVMPQSQKGRKIEHLSTTSQNSIPDEVKEEAVLIFLT